MASVIQVEKAIYFPIQQYWWKLRSIYQSEECRKIWHPCMEQYMRWRGFQNGFKHTPKPDAPSPSWYDSCDWRFDRPGRKPAFWDYVCHSACHWVADMNLFVAMQAFPKDAWRIITSEEHSTVWNGEPEPVLFDTNFLALGVSAPEAMRLALKGKIKKPGKWLKRNIHQ